MNCWVNSSLNLSPWRNNSGDWAECDAPLVFFRRVRRLVRRKCWLLEPRVNLWQLYSELATIQISPSKTYHSCRLVTCNFVTKWLMGVRSNDSTVRFVFKCARFLSHSLLPRCYRWPLRSTKFGLLINFDLLKARTSTNKTLNTDVYYTLAAKKPDSLIMSLESTIEQ